MRRVSVVWSATFSSGTVIPSSKPPMEKEALNILENRRPGLDMAILDVMMPGMDGFEVLRELREQEHGETHLPVMLLTARAEDADQVRGLEGGADDYVTKPFSPIVLAARVRTLLKRRPRRCTARTAGQAVGQ